MPDSPLRQCTTAHVGLPVCWFHFAFSGGSAPIPLPRSSAPIFAWPLSTERTEPPTLLSQKTTRAFFDLSVYLPSLNKADKPQDGRRLLARSLYAGTASSTCRTNPLSAIGSTGSVIILGSILQETATSQTTCSSTASPPTRPCRCRSRTFPGSARYYYYG